MSSPNSSLNDPQNLAIAVLSLTAGIMLVALLLIRQPAAQAIGMVDRAGDYIIAPQQLSSTSEAIAVIDAAAKQMLIYEFDYNNKNLQILSRVPLDQLPKPALRSPPPAQRRPSGTGP